MLCRPHSELCYRSKHPIFYAPYKRILPESLCFDAHGDRSQKADTAQSRDKDNSAAYKNHFRKADIILDIPREILKHVIQYICHKDLNTHGDREHHFKRDTVEEVKIYPFLIPAITRAYKIQYKRYQRRYRQTHCQNVPLLIDHKKSIQKSVEAAIYIHIIKGILRIM